MKATIYQNSKIEAFIDALKAELEVEGLRSHISWHSDPPLPEVKYAVHSDCRWIDFLDFISDNFPVVCVYRQTGGVLYLAIMANKDWLEKQYA